jgi:hypothetical protein
MALPADWWTTNLEDEPCDDCGSKPSRHAGHGSFICKACNDARWCPKCTFALGDPTKHVCPSPEERERHERERHEREADEWLKELKEMGVD